MKYDNYKDSGIEWIGEIPEHWDISKLKFHCKIFNGDSLKDDEKIKYSAMIENSVPYVSTKDIDLDASKIDYHNGLRIPIDNIKFKIAPKNSFLICIEGGSAGRKLAFVDEDIYFVNKLACFNSNENNNSKYLFFYIQSPLFQKQFQISMSGLIGGVAISLIRNFESLFPPIDEQLSIANYLDHKTTQIDTLIAKKQQFISLLQEERTALINQAVTKGLDPKVKMKDSGIEWLGEIPEHWEVKKLKFFCFITKLSGFEYTKEWETNENGEIIALRGYNISNGKVNDIKTERISSELSLKLFRSKLYKNDIVYPCTGTIGNAAIIQENDKYHINQNIARINPNTDLVYPEFLFYNLIADATKKQIDFNNSSSMQPVILIGDLRNITIAFPPYEEQFELVVMIEKALKKIDTVFNNSLQEIELLKEYKTALISEVVTGKVDVRKEKLN
ncbi:type I restriction enzyme, S subunit [Flavobacterium xueshanense]|uniref:Type I restriction enzyme, S subunit n=2 Tax=Flavobacterium xueshanense TaxID=935223 RepID=A0A1I2ECU5_9FLAO|nr:type I restriction enzyme, S subunit [Flavobacterium xueshanense]